MQWPMIMNLVNDNDFQPKNPITLMFNVGMFVCHYIFPCFSCHDIRHVMASYLYHLFEYQLLLFYPPLLKIPFLNPSQPVVKQTLVIFELSIQNVSFANPSVIMCIAILLDPNLVTHFIKLVFPRPYPLFVPNLQSLGNIPTIWPVGNPYFSRYPIML